MARKKAAKKKLKKKKVAKKKPKKRKAAKKKAKAKPKKATAEDWRYKKSVPPKKRPRKGFQWGWRKRRTSERKGKDVKVRGHWAQSRVSMYPRHYVPPEPTRPVPDVDIAGDEQFVWVQPHEGYKAERAGRTITVAPQEEGHWSVRKRGKKPVIIRDYPGYEFETVVDFDPQVSGDEVSVPPLVGDTPTDKMWSTVFAIEAAPDWESARGHLSQADYYHRILQARIDDDYPTEVSEVSDLTPEQKMQYLERTSPGLHEALTAAHERYAERYGTKVRSVYVGMYREAHPRKDLKKVQAKKGKRLAKLVKEKRKKGRRPKIIVAGE